MRIVENSELSNYKVLPFDLFTENKTKILEAGEVLTPGKLIMLKNYVRIYAEDFLSENSSTSKKLTQPFKRHQNKGFLTFHTNHLTLTNLILS